MREQRLACVTLPDYAPRHGRHDGWGFDPEEQRSRTYLGMGEDDINLHDQWAVESMGAIQDRTREHLGSTDKVIMANRRTLLTRHDVAGAVGQSLMRAATDAGLDGIKADCGGCLSCATCHVVVDPAWADRLPPPSSDEEAMLETTAAPRRPTSRLSCQIVLGEDLDGLVAGIPGTQY